MSSRGVIPVRKVSNPQPPSSSMAKTGVHPPQRQQPTVHWAPAPAATSSSKFNRGVDESGLSAVFGHLDLQSDDVDKENSSHVPEQLLKQVFI